MTHLKPIHLNITTLVDNSPKQAPQTIKVNLGSPLQKLTDAMLRCYNQMQSGLSLHERVVKIQSEPVIPDLQIKLLQLAMKEALKEAPNNRAVVTTFQEIKQVCTLQDDVQTYFLTHFKPVIQIISAGKQLSKQISLSPQEFQSLIDSLKDPAISEMLGLFYECELKDETDLSTFRQNTAYKTKLSCKTPFSIDPTAVAEALKENNTLTSVYLGKNYLGTIGAIAFADVLRKNRTLTSISLEEAEIPDTGAVALAKALKENQSLTSLSLRCNFISAAGAKALAEVLTENHTLISLTLWDNPIGAAGAESLAEALKINHTLTNLDLWDTQIGDAGAETLAEALKENHTLTRLNLTYNKIGDAGTQALAESLKKNKALTGLVLHSNQIGDAGAESLAEALNKNHTLKRLNLWANQIALNAAKVFEPLKNRIVIII